MTRVGTTKPERMRQGGVQTEEGGDDAAGELLAALRRAGIDYPAERMGEAVAEFRDLRAKIALIRAAHD